ncbi:ankyrin repeat protein [Colletotrichum truncatum]|uniref:Ankyrin repeat protein n=1 Tax=Colletotrichum truncatum TaxID=5467 RepID=A0ACC3ZDY2_COLTU
MSQQLANENYTVGWICAIATERVAAQAFLDEEHAEPSFVAERDDNDYTLGRIGKHNVVIAALPDGEYGIASATGVATDMLHSFPNIRIGLMVGIGGGAPSPRNDIRLGDIVVSAPRDGRGGVFQYDFGKAIQDQAFRTTGFLEQPPTVLRTAVSGLKAQHEINGHQLQEAIKEALNRKPRLRKRYSQPDPLSDRLYRSDFIHPSGDETDCATSCGYDSSRMIARPPREEEDDNPAIHYGLVASANRLMKDALVRDKLAQEKGVLCFEMEAAGLMNRFPCLVIRGVCDYSDTHKNKEWRGYAAMAAAAYAKDLLKRIAPNKVEAEKKMAELLGDVKEQLSNIQNTANETSDKIESLQAENLVMEIRKWLAPPDASSNFNRARSQHQQGTSQWLLQSDIYQKWKGKSDPNTFLWLNGIPGCGKTILSSSIIADLDANPASSSGLLFFYFDFSDTEKQTVRQALRSLISQLYSKQHDTRKEVHRLFSSCNSGGRQPSDGELLSLFQSMAKETCELWIVLDALDECEARNGNSANRLLSWIKSLHNTASSIHLLVTSRPEQHLKADIEQWANDEDVISLQGNLVEDDIALYVKNEVSRMKRWHQRQDIQHEIQQALTEKAGAMFRWVSCQVDMLQNCLDPLAIRRELSSLPRTLDETYARILRQLRPEHVPYATRLLQFLTYSERPLQLEEAVDAIAVDTTRRPGFKPENRMPSPDEITRYCSGLVVVVSRPNIYGRHIAREIQLAHFSVQEYLRSDRLQPELARELNESASRTAMAEVCLYYLLDLDHSLARDAAKLYPTYLAHYSAQYWVRNAKVAEICNREALPAVKEYLSSPKAFGFGFNLYPPEPKMSRKLPEENPMYYAALGGLVFSVWTCIQDGADVNAQGGEYHNALQAASNGGHRETVQLLLQNGADVNKQGGFFGNALQVASFRGQVETVKLLLMKGANVNIQGGVYGNALQAASRCGHGEIVEMLLSMGADINAKGGLYGTALQAASGRGNERIVLTLLSKGADVNIEGGWDGTALCAASLNGNERVVKMLLDKGANVHANVHSNGGERINALDAALLSGYGKIAEMLLEKGAKNSNNVTKRYGNHKGLLSRAKIGMFLLTYY